ncbi:AMP-binding enzyme family protein (macronuclear) [Tetrahymena thermophila SB210]|uniref:AMP-binding enzyme family protein n=1 Tax=Tetrahymena thermophila (strain SB210) TaxID=312017 RepID=W7XDR2_TETTS|nr:AMP-binding enzyme family protein [Tetrahymena thermophila SB210]EWS74788.1 AMP-binding enzyme family protein [Tetrahymena thermophila SB210]|eukprot:XP_012652681.1 AMP-binding enzyme family protein [Tetrahymena thermophila SB210]
MIISKIDLFSSQFSFNVNDKHMKKGTILGAFLSILVVLTSLTYFVYILKQYITNQIEPTFRSQSFITDHTLNIPLSSDLIAFKFDYGNNYLLEKQKEKTYIVYVAFFYYQSNDDQQFITLDVIDCTNPSLLGFKCVDFTNLSNYTLTHNSQINLSSQIQILTYGCRDIDSLKTTMPNNCAEQSEIDDIVNGINAGQKFKLYTSQYNATSQEVQVNYRNLIVYTYSMQSITTILNASIQTTSVKQGLIVQNEETFSTPLSYSQVNQGIDRQQALSIGVGPYSIAMLQVDEIVQYVQIQYSTLPQILALINSIFAFLMLIGIIGRYASQRSIQKDFLMLFLKTIYQDYYLKNLNVANFFNNQSQQQQVEIKEQENEENKIHEDGEKVDELHENGIVVPAFQNKQKQSLDLEQPKNIPQASSFKLKFQDKPFSQEQKEVLTECVNTDRPLNDNNKEEKDKILILPQDSVIEGSNTNQDSPWGDDAVSQFSYSYRPNLAQSIKRSNSSQFYNSKLRNNRLSEIKNQESQMILRRLSTIHNQNVQTKVENVIFSKKTFKQQDQINLQQKNNKMMKKIEQQIQKELNILNFVKDILFLKKAILMMLSQEQLAALQVISCSQNFLDLNLNEKFENIKQLEEQFSLSHYEKSFALMENDKFQLAYLNKFLNRCQNDDNLSPLDLKIIQTLKKCHIN